ncbi:MAG: succinylglutamate desuccinylase/aspartoacylase family protein [Bacteroidota bacterium]|nr:succinylglutamate desuccinylase/aspartoacylase family protein [Bacteroidota bacterium]
MRRTPVIKEIVINGVNILPGQKIKVDIGIARLPSHTLIDLPVYVFRSKKPGPVLLLTAGIHGDEINGIEIVRRLILGKKLMPEAGTIIAIPLVNVYGFIHNSRSLPDGKDLNRCFPGGEGGSLARRIAHIIMTEIVPYIDYGIDFHTGGSRIYNFPQIRSVLNESLNVELSKAFGAKYIINSGFIDKSFRKEAYKMGKCILVFEGGESLRIDEFSIKEGMDGVCRIMKHLKMKDVNVKHQDSIILRESAWVRARISGIFNSFVECGGPMKKGKEIASLSDPFGETKVNIKGHVNGFVIGIKNMPVVSAGDALFHVGQVID